MNEDLTAHDQMFENVLQDLNLIEDFPIEDDNKTKQGIVHNDNSHMSSEGVTNSRVSAKPLRIHEVEFLSIKQPPIDLDFKGQLEHLLSSNLFSNVQSESVQLFHKFSKMILEKKYIKLVASLFWTIFILKLKKNTYPNLLRELRRKLSKRYGKYFATLPNPKEELTNLGVLTAGYVCNTVYYNTFQQDRNLFDKRFVLNCYHIIIFELNGIFVSDFYIQSSLEKLFGNKYYFYEMEDLEKSKLSKEELNKESIFFRENSYDFKDFSQVAGGMAFARELTTKLLPKRTKNSRKAMTERTYPKTTNASPNRETPAVEKNFTRVIPKPFPRKLKLNCHQLSPTVSTFLESSTKAVPWQKKLQINYSTNTPTPNLKSIELESKQFNGDRQASQDKKEKDKKQIKGTITDYKLKVRPENYYLNHLPKPLKKRFGSEIDLKYIMDNVKVTFREVQTTRESKEPKGSKFLAQFESGKGEKISGDLPLSKENSFFQGENKNHLLGAHTPQKSSKENGLSNTLSNRIRDKILENEQTKIALPQVVLMKTKTSELCLVKSTSSNLLINKAQEVLPDDSKEKQENWERSQRRSSVISATKRDIFISTLKYDQKINRTLGKGQERISLEQVERIQPTPRIEREFVYKDNRLNYSKVHGSLLKGSVDANINELVQKLLVKQNIFNRNFGKYAKLKKNV